MAKQKIDNIRIPIKFELRSVEREDTRQYGEGDAFAYTFIVFVNGKKLSRRESMMADSIKELRKKVMEKYFRLY